MQSTSVLIWFRGRRVVALFAALVLAATIAVGLIAGTAPAPTAAGDEPAATEVVADDGLIIAGPSWTWYSSTDPGLPPLYLGPSWG